MEPGKSKIKVKAGAAGENGFLIMFSPSEKG